MALESGLYVNDLVPTNPGNADQLALAAAQIRLVKDCLQGSFPNLDDDYFTRNPGEGSLPAAPAVNLTAAVINGLPDRITALDDQTLAQDVALCNRLQQTIPNGTRLLFNNVAAPSELWLMQNTDDMDDSSLRVINANTTGYPDIPQSGGTAPFSTVFNHTHTQVAGALNADAHALSIEEMPAHTHTENYATVTNRNPDGSGDTGSSYMFGQSTKPSGITGGDGSETPPELSPAAGHTHTISGTVDEEVFTPKYVNLIVCEYYQSEACPTLPDP